MKEESIIRELLNSLPQVGAVQAITVRPERRTMPQERNEVVITRENGIAEDHFHSTSKKRQVTLIQDEHLTAVATLLNKEKIDPRLTRRNVVVRGINLLALHNRQFQIGDVILKGTGYCEPCNRMEENLGPGGYNAMRGHGYELAQGYGDLKPTTFRIGNMGWIPEHYISEMLETLGKVVS